MHLRSQYLQSDDDSDDSNDEDSDDEDSDIETTDNKEETVEVAPVVTPGRRKGRRAVSTGVISTNSWLSVCSRSSCPPPIPAPRWRPTASISSNSRSYCVNDTFKSV